MKITFDTSVKYQPPVFHDVPRGETFLYNDQLFMKIKEFFDTKGSCWNAVCLSDGSLEEMCENDAVIPIQCHITQ